VSKSLTPFVSQSQEVDLDCSSCPFAIDRGRDGIHEWTDSVKSDLKLKFATRDNKLSLNGIPFYPIGFPQLPPQLFVKQVAKKDESGMSTEVEHAYPADLKLSYSLEINDVKHFANPGEEEADLISIVISIMGLDDRMVQVDDIQIKLLKDANSALHIIDVFPVRPSREDLQCTTLICRFFAKINANMRAAKSAANSAAKKVGQKVRICCLRCMRFFRGAFHHGKHHAAHHHSHMRPNSGHTKPQVIPAVIPEIITEVKPAATPDATDVADIYHDVVHGFFIGIKTAFAFVIFPALAGIAFGVVASAVGMLIGQFAVFLWGKYRRRGEIAYEKVDDDDSEKDGLPAYEDVQAKEDVEKA
jgi:hypothetical protein